MQTTFEKGRPRKVPVKLFENQTCGFREDFFRITSCCYVQEAPIHQSNGYGWIKISQTIFRKGHPRKVPVKLFQNLSRGFKEEDFLRISSCPYSPRSSHSPEPCLWMDQILQTIFKKGHPRNNPVKLFKKRTSREGHNGHGVAHLSLLVCVVNSGGGDLSFDPGASYEQTW